MDFNAELKLKGFKVYEVDGNAADHSYYLVRRELTGFSEAALKLRTPTVHEAIASTSPPATTNINTFREI